MIGARRFGIFVTIMLLTTQLVSGCSLFEKKDENLPLGRNVRLVPFPVRELEFRDLKCRQELEQLTLSGSLNNISYSPLSRVYVRAVVFFADESPAEVLILSVSPSILQPAESGTFMMTGTVQHTISHIELHANSEPYFPPGL